MLLETKGISCSKGDKQLFTQVNFSLAEGEALQVVAANGVGKTSLLKIISGISSSYIGELIWHNLEAKHRLIYLGHRNGLQPHLTPIENLEFLLAINQQPVDRGDLIAALDTLGMRRCLHLECARLSAGQSQRVALARLLLQSAKIWILDEPCSALDVSGVSKLEAMIEKHLTNNGSVVLATHQKLLANNPRLKTMELANFNV